jgi:hypothetical protein
MRRKSKTEKNEENMNKTFKYALSAVLGVAMVTPAFAQGFPDVQDTHWAYEAVTRLKKEGIITGYPDGTFQGKKNITRYELATLIYAIYQNTKNVTDGLTSQIEALEARVNAMKPSAGGNGGSDASTLAALKALQSDVSSMKAWGSDVAQLKKMASSYEKELSSLGVDVEAMKKDLKDLDARIKVLESKKSNVTISGDVNFFVTAGTKGSVGNAIINQDGRVAGGSATGAGIDTLGVNHELGLTLKTDTAKATLVVGNAVGAGTGFVDQSRNAGNYATAYGQNGATNVYLHELYANLSDSLVGMSFDAKIGRQGVKISPYVMQRLDTTSFFENERYDNGEFALDGITAGFSFGGNTKLGLFLGNVGGANLGGTQVQGITIGAEEFGLAGTNTLNVARAMGAVLKFGLGDNGGITAALATFDGNTISAGTTQTGGAGYNRNEVYGVDLDYKLGGNLSIMGGVGKSSFKTNKTDNSAGDNQRQNYGVKFSAGALDLGVNYRKIEANYQAPGDWGRMGFYRNVNDVKGVDFNVGYKVSDNLSVSGSVANLDQVSGAGNRAVESSNFGANFKINSNWTLMATYEDTKFKNNFYNNDTFKYTTLGFGYDMGANTLFKLWYQVGDIQTTANAATNGAGQAKGSFIGAQFSVKF